MPAAAAHQPRRLPHRRRAAPPPREPAHPAGSPRSRRPEWRSGAVADQLTERRRSPTRRARRQPAPALSEIAIPAEPRRRPPRRRRADAEAKAAGNIETSAARRRTKRGSARRRLPARSSVMPAAILALACVDRGADRLARHRRAPCAADGFALCRDRHAGEPARPDVLRRQGVATRPRTACRCWSSKASSPAPRRSRSRCRGCALRCATTPAARSTPGPRCRRREVLEPGETLPFRSRLASPPGEGRDVHGALLHAARRRRRTALRPSWHAS